MFGYEQHLLRMDDLRRTAEHQRLVREALAGRKEDRGARPRRRTGREDRGPVWVEAA